MMLFQKEKPPLTTPLWEQLPEEPFRAFAAFARFRDLGPRRTVRSAFFSLNPPTRYAKNKGGCTRAISGQWFNWCRKYDWGNRARAYDAHKRPPKVDELFDHFAEQDLKEESV